MARLSLVSLLAACLLMELAFVVEARKHPKRKRPSKFDEGEAFRNGWGMGEAAAPGAEEDRFVIKPMPPNYQGAEVLAHRIMYEAQEKKIIIPVKLDRVVVLSAFKILEGQHKDGLIVQAITSAQDVAVSVRVLCCSVSKCDHES